VKSICEMIFEINFLDNYSKVYTGNSDSQEVNNSEAILEVDSQNEAEKNRETSILKASTLLKTSEADNMDDKEKKEGEVFFLCD
jgi:hypothetical protein